MFNPYNDILSHLKQNLNSLILQKVTYIFVVVVQVVGDKVRMNIHISLQVQCSSHSITMSLSVSNFSWMLSFKM